MHKYHKIVFWVHLTVLLLITTVWGKTSKLWYLREFSAQVSQIVFWVHLTVFTTSYNCMRKNFKNLISPWVQCTSITNRGLSLIWPFYDFLQLYEEKLEKSHISVSSVQKYKKSCSPSSYDRFTDFFQVHEVNLQKSHISVSLVHKYHKSCS